MAEKVEKKELEWRTEAFIQAYKRAVSSKQSVDMFEQQNAMRELHKQTKHLFICMETYANNMVLKDFRRYISNRKYIDILLFLCLRSLYTYNEELRVTLYTDARCIESTKLAMKVIDDYNFKKNFGSTFTGETCDILFKNIIIQGVRVHPTLMQSIIRNLVETLRASSEIKSQKVPDYMIKFENTIFYYLYECPENERIYLAFI